MNIGPLWLRMLRDNVGLASPLPPPETATTAANAPQTQDRYQAINAMLLNDFLKEHRKVEQLQKQVEALTAGLQKVSAQHEASKPATQLADSNY